MANLQVKDIDDNLYAALKIRAKNKRRSVSQEVIRLIEDYLSQPDDRTIDSTKQFLSLSWTDDTGESADDIIAGIKKDRKQGIKFRGNNNVFDR
jgi:hypothetical protein